MASQNDAAVIDVESSSQSEAEAKLQFQEFADSQYEEEASRTKLSQTHMFTSFPDSVDDDTEQSDLLGEKRPPSMWTFEFYQSFFDVDTVDVLRRILWSMIPRPGFSYLQYHIRPNPDLYGPFWVCTTLIFTIAIMGNLANYLTVANSGDYVWHYDFQKVSLAATAVYAYSSVCPLLLWIFVWHRKNNVACSFLEMLCVYGYSLSVYIPISVFWVIKVRALQWLLVVVGSILSGSVLLTTLWPTFKNDSKKISICLMILIGLLHFTMAAGFLLYFFYVPEVRMRPGVIVTSPTAIASSSVTATSQTTG